MVGAHTRDCEYCGAAVLRCSKCSTPATYADQQVCHSCMASLSSPAVEESAWKGPTSVSRKSSSLSDWQLVLVLALVAAVALGVYAFSSGWQTGGEVRVEGSYASCLAANGYQEDADIAQLGVNRRASERCEHLLDQ